ncbi:GINS complex, PSF2 component [Aaosphaeria arxii CBS 175.79]|uniref:DNA replication complex GINS protein PSF2 n=1 Tax=Aaosphaeria arxii CBS 175.79 TaxID=1450172 RepID=A0A6A5XLN7_9PLEO|nr:GINS complex, PSF2 component [Aaosphaeria arxii CBS 175.79]KAF2013816.1 GINS complex, PSF2 component [Aaosphaeria arxii CBS 175.79]
MALPLPPGLTPAEVAFLCEMEQVTVMPRQTLEGLDLLGGSIPPLDPRRRAVLPLWLALLLKRQRRANIIPPPWLNPHSLKAVLDDETKNDERFSPPPRLPPVAPDTTTIFSPPFLPSSTADAAPDALPYHWLELGEMLLEAAEDDFEDPESVRRYLRDLREVRLSKVRRGTDQLVAAGSISLTGAGGMEIAEGRSFITGVIDGLRKISASREQQRRDREREEGEGGYPGTADDDEDDEMEMQ